MALKAFSQFDSSDKSFNMTPIIDIVFLLIIFFVLISQFIEAENFPLEVPDDCNFANSDIQHNTQVTTLTVMKNDAGKVDFAVGSQKIIYSDYPEAVEQLTFSLDAQMKDIPADKRIVTLRVDKDICYDQAQYALAAIAASCATDIQLAALKEKR